MTCTDVNCIPVGKNYISEGIYALKALNIIFIPSRLSHGLDGISRKMLLLCSNPRNMDWCFGSTSFLLTSNTFVFYIVKNQLQNGTSFTRVLWKTLDFNIFIPPPLRHIKLDGWPQSYISTPTTSSGRVPQASLIYLSSSEE